MKSRGRGEGRKRGVRATRDTRFGLELLEPRRLLSAVLRHGVWSIRGDENKTNYNDAIAVAFNAATQQFDLTSNGIMVQSRPTAGVRRIVIRGGRGDDVINLDAAGTGVGLWVYGGQGNDTIIGSSGRDVLRGDAGDDNIDGQDGNDWIDGGRGDDTVIAGAGQNRVRGGYGADTVYAVVGRDAIGKDRTDVFVDAELPQSESGILPIYLREKVTYTGELRQRLIDQAVEQYRKNFGKIYETNVAFLMASGTPHPSLLSQATLEAGLNSQAGGAGEASLMCTDGNYLYVLRDRQLLVIDVRDPAKSKIVAMLNVGAEQGSGLYLKDGRLVVVATRQDHRLSDAIARDFWEGIPARAPGASVLVYDVSTPAHPALLEQSDFLGTLVSARMVGDQLSLVFNNTLTLPGPRPVPVPGIAATGFRYQSEDEYRQWLDLHLDEYLPIYSTRGSDSLRTNGSMLESMQYAGAENLRNITTVVMLDVADGVPGLAAIASATASASVVYLSGNNLYLFGPHARAPGAAHLFAPAPDTDILKFGLGTHAVQIDAVGTVHGVAYTFPAADEWNGQLRVAAQIISPGSVTWWEGPQRLYVLGSHVGVLTVDGVSDNFGAGGSLGAVQFFKGTAFVTAYNGKGTLSTIDLSDSSHPVLAGTVEFPGLASTVFPMDESHFVSVGLDAVAATVRVSLFDGTDLADPRLVAQKVYAVPNGSVRFEALWDPRGLSYFSDAGVLAIPLTTYVPNGSGVSYSMLLLQVDSAGGLTEISQLPHNSVVRGSIKSGENLILLANSGLQIVPLSDAAHPIAEIIFPQLQSSVDMGYWSYFPIDLVPAD